jgi:hypothetical protein
MINISWGHFCPKKEKLIICEFVLVKDRAELRETSNRLTVLHGSHGDLSQFYMVVMVIYH